MNEVHKDTFYLKIVLHNLNRWKKNSVQAVTKMKGCLVIYYETHKN